MTKLKPLITSYESLIEGIFLGAILLMLVTAGLVHTGAVPRPTQPSLYKVVDSPNTLMPQSQITPIPTHQ